MIVKCEKTLGRARNTSVSSTEQLLGLVHRVCLFRLVFLERLGSKVAADFAVAELSYLFSSGVVDTAVYMWPTLRCLQAESSSA